MNSRTDQYPALIDGVSTSTHSTAHDTVAERHNSLVRRYFLKGSVLYGGGGCSKLSSLSLIAIRSLNAIPCLGSSRSTPTIPRSSFDECCVSREMFKTPSASIAHRLCALPGCGHPGSLPGKHGNLAQIPHVLRTGGYCRCNQTHRSQKTPIPSIRRRRGMSWFYARRRPHDGSPVGSAESRLGAHVPAAWPLSA